MYDNSLGDVVGELNDVLAMLEEDRPDIVKIRENLRSIIDDLETNGINVDLTGASVEVILSGYATVTPFSNQGDDVDVDISAV